ncbi:MAG: response regulator [Alphaproteobacteria bacterium]|nr:response regulator [Alphaproteobacteria bacterium]
MSARQSAQADLGMRTLKALLASVIVLFTMATAYTSVVIVERQRTLEDSARYSLTWPLSQAINELGRFIQVSALHVAGAGGIDEDDVTLRYEVLLNRSRMLESSLVRNFIEAESGRQTVLAEFRRALAEIEPLTADLRGKDVANRIVEPLRRLEPRLVGLASEAFRHEAELSAADARALQKLHNLFSTLAAGLVLCGFAFIGLVLWQTRMIRRGRDRLQSMADDLRRTTVSHQFLDDIVNGMSEGLLVVDHDGRIAKANDSAGRLLGYPTQDLTGRPIAVVAPDLDSGGDRAASLAAVTTMRTADGRQLPVRVSTGPVADGSAEGGTICVFEDLTHRRQAEAEKAALRERLYEAQKVQAIGTLAGGIAHDFNNILGTILGYSFLALEDLPDGHPVRAALNQISVAGNRARDLVRQIVAYSRNVVAERAPVELGPITETSIAALRAQAPKRVEIVVAPMPRAVVSGDRSQLDQVITNLCQNAIQAIGEAGGRVEVRLEVVASDGQAMGGLAGFKGRSIAPSTTSAVEPGEAEAWVGVLEARRYARLTVEDTGCGMTRATMDRIFEPFFTTKEVGKGTGLGLAAVHGILRTHDGVMHVISRPGSGSRFELYLPLSTSDSPHADETSRPSPTDDGRGRILIVDDNPDVLDIACKSLTRYGYEVEAHLQATSALETVRRAPSAWDLVITDRTMPGMSGEEFAVLVRQARTDISIIMVTGFADGRDEERILASGVDKLLFKPLVGAALADAVNETLERRPSQRRAA